MLTEVDTATPKLDIWGMSTGPWRRDKTGIPKGAFTRPDGIDDSLLDKDGRLDVGSVFLVNSAALLVSGLPPGALPNVSRILDRLLDPSSSLAVIPIRYGASQRIVAVAVASESALIKYGLADREARLRKRIQNLLR